MAWEKKGWSENMVSKGATNIVGLWVAKSGPNNAPAKKYQGKPVIESNLEPQAGSNTGQDSDVPSTSKYTQHTAKRSETAVAMKKWAICSHPFPTPTPNQCPSDSSGRDGELLQALSELHEQSVEAILSWKLSSNRSRNQTSPSPKSVVMDPKKTSAKT